MIKTAAVVGRSEIKGKGGRFVVMAVSWVLKSELGLGHGVAVRTKTSSMRGRDAAMSPEQGREGLQVLRGLGVVEAEKKG